MQDERTKREKQVAPMQKRRETMPDGRRYIIYYTFENGADSVLKAEEEKAETAEEASENV
jgi:hypothetical protein